MNSSSLQKAARGWLKTPRLTFAIVSCIAVAIAGASTVLTFVYGLLLRPLPFPEASRLVMLEPRGFVSSQAVRPYFSYPEFADLRRATATFETLDAATVSRLVVVTDNGAERLRGEVVTPGYFRLFGLTPQKGRPFATDEYEGRGPRAMLISSRLWRSHFASNENVIGRSVQTRAGPVEIIGVMPERFLGVAEDEGTDYWLAERQNNAPMMLSDRAEPTSLVFGRLRDGVSRGNAEAEVDSVLSRLAAAHPDDKPRQGASLQAFGEKWRGDLRPGLLTMLVASIFLLAIGCGNVAILLIARLIDRERELAVRLAIGARRSDLVKLMWTEGSLLACVGGGLGILLSIWLGALFRSVGGMALPSHLPVAFGGAPLALSLVVVLLTGAVFTMAPAWTASRIDSSTALRSGGRSVAVGALQGSAGRLLVVFQTALAVALLCGAAMFLRSYDRLRFADMGFRTDNLLRYQVSLQPENYPTPDSIEAFYRQLAIELRAIPGVRASGYLGPTLPPFDARSAEVRIKGQESGSPGSGLTINQHFATNDALAILQVALREGRLFASEDRAGGAPVALVSESLGKRLAPRGSAIGKVLVLDNATEVTVVGVVADARWNGQRNRRPTGFNLFLSLTQFPQLSVGVLFDPAVEARSLIEPVRRVVLARDSTAALHWIDTMEEALDFQTVSERFWTILAAAYASTALLLSVLGLYGILSHSVATRAKEIGVRLALGATSGAVARFVTLAGVRLILTGLAAGLALALASGRLIQSRLHETSAADPLALGAVIAILLVSGTLTAWLPARRASRVSPLAALRSE